jgi:hypothetical protein
MVSGIRHAADIEIAAATADEAEDKARRALADYFEDREYVTDSISAEAVTTIGGRVAGWLVRVSAHAEPPEATP